MGVKLGASVVAIAIAVFGLTAQGQQSQGDYQTEVTKEQLDRWMVDLSNTGRWGPDDQRGTLNLITPEKRKAAAALVQTGTSFSLARDIATDEQFTLEVSASAETGITMERHTIDYHNPSWTHIDALCHVAHEGKVYNDTSYRENISNEKGCSKGGLGPLTEGIVTRAILLDIPRLKGVPYLEPGTPVYRADIEVWESRAGVKISSGDAILLRSGRWTHQAEFGPSTSWSGFDADIGPLLKERDVAVIGADGNGEVTGGGAPGFSLPIKKFAFVMLGMPILNALDLEAVAEEAARLNRWEFMLVVGPNPVSLGAGSIINPIAVF